MQITEEDIAAFVKARPACNKTAILREAGIDSKYLSYYRERHGGVYSVAHSLALVSVMQRYGYNVLLNKQENK